MITAAPSTKAKATSRSVVAALGLLTATALTAPGLSAQHRGPMARAAAPRVLALVERALRHAEGLELTGGQQDQLEAIRADMVERRVDHSARMMRLASEARAGLTETGAVREALATMREEAGGSRRALREKYGEVLTDEQRQRLRRLTRRAAWHPRGARGGGPGWDRGWGKRGRGAMERGRRGDRFRGWWPPERPRR